MGEGSEQKHTRVEVFTSKMCMGCSNSTTCQAGLIG